jgi:toxin ParE1/3/4
MLKVASDPKIVASRDRSELSAGIRSFHIRHVRSVDPAARVERPVHILFYRAIGPSLVEIVRVLHERMEPNRHIGTGSQRR